MGSVQKKYLVVALLAGVTILSFAYVTQCLFINYDDPGYVTKNNHVRNGISLQSVEWSLTATEQSNWHPLTWISHSIDCTVFGLDPAYHHAMNVFLHLLSSILLFLLLEKITHSIWQSAFVAIVFAIHPLHVESVAWVAERKDVLSAFFWMVTLWAYVRYRESPGKAKYLVTLFAFVLGLMAKPMLITLPFVLILLDYWPLDYFKFNKGQPAQERKKNIGLFKKSFIEKIPFMILTIGSSIITYYVQLEGGSMARSGSLSFPMRASNALVSYVQYLWKTIIPGNLSIFYPHPEGTLPMWEIAGSIGILIGISLIVWKKREQYPFLIVGWLWFLGTLVPVIGIVQVGLQAMADRYMYIPMVGVSIIVAWGAPALLTKINVKRYILAGGFILVTLAMIVGTRSQVPYWKDSITLFTHSLAVTKDNHLAENNLGAALADSGRHQEALAHLEEAYRIKPDEKLIHANLARSLVALGRRKEALVHYNWILERIPNDPALHERMGDVLADEGRITEAISHFLFVITVDSTDAATICKLADLYTQQSNLVEGNRYCARALRIDPKNAKAHDVLGIIAAKEGRLEDALKEFSEALDLDSKNAEIHYDLGILYDRIGQADKAKSAYLRAIQLNPDYWDAHFNVGLLFAMEGQLNDAETHLLKASELNPTSVPVHINLAKLYGLMGNMEQSTKEIQSALALDSNNVLVRFGYGNLLVKQGKMQEAEVQYITAVTLDSTFQPARNALSALQKKKNP